MLRLMEARPSPATPTRRLGLAVAIAQAALALSWTVYVVFLPALAQQAGLPLQAVPLLLMLDQAVFLVADYACGVASDRVLGLHRRLAPWLVAATGLSALAFVLMPWLAPQGSPAVLIGLAVIWTATSSALRAPPLNLIGRHAARPQQPGLVAVAMVGLGLAAALAPWLALALKGVDPRLPFAAASLGVVLAALALAVAEREVAAPPPGPDAQPVPPVARPAPSAPYRWPFWVAAALLAALAMQVHTVLNAPAQFRRFLPAEALPQWLPLFWAAFSLALWPAMRLASRWGGRQLLVRAALLGSAAAVLAASAPALVVLALAQVLTGAAWAALLAGGFAAALAMGHVGWEGRCSGTVSSSLAAAALVRISLVAAGVAAAWRAGAPLLLDLLPALLWAISAALMRAAGPAGTVTTQTSAQTPLTDRR